MIFNRKKITHFMIVSSSTILVQNAMWITCVQNCRGCLLQGLAWRTFTWRTSAFSIYSQRNNCRLSFVIPTTIRFDDADPSVTPSTNLAQLRTALNKSDIFRRGIYLVISFAGITYELLQTNEVRWFLLGGYGFIIVVTLYSFYVQGSKRNEEIL